MAIAWDWVVEGLGDRPVDQTKYLDQLDAVCGAEPLTQPTQIAQSSRLPSRDATSPIMNRV